MINGRSRLPRDIGHVQPELLEGCPVETMLEAIRRLRADGYLLDLSAVPGGRLRSSGSDEVIDARGVTVEETVRFEGDSNPDDQAILAALVTPAGHRGLYSSAYGPDAPADDAEVLRAMARH